MNLYIRFFANVLKNLIFPSRKPVADDGAMGQAIFEETSLKMRVLPNDLDVNFHMNNGRFLAIMDIGRMDYTMRMGLHKVMAKEKWGAVASAINVVYMKSLNLFNAYELKTKLLSWDESWFYMEQNFVRDNKVCASAVVKATFIKGGKRVSPQVVMEKVSQASVKAPVFPEYLENLIKGEEAFIAGIKKFNRGE